MSGTQHLVQMANDIATSFEPSRIVTMRSPALKITSKVFWTRRMREKLLAQLEHGDAGLDELPREAVRRLSKHPNSKPKHSPGGDAG